MVGVGGFVFGGDANGGGGGDGKYGYSNVQLFKWGGYCSNYNLRDRE